MNLVVADETLARGIADSIRWTNTDADGTPVDATTVTVSVVRSDGTTLVASGAASHVSGDTGNYTKALTASQLDTLDVLTATWVADGVEHVTLVEVVGRLLFTVTEARASHRTLTDTAKYTTADIVRVRAEVTAELEEICDRSFVPRFRRLVVDGDGSLALHVGDNDLRSVVSATVEDTALDAGELADLYLHEHQTIEQPAGSSWAYGRANVEIAFEFGLDGPAPTVKRAAMVRLRELLNEPDRGIPARAKSANPEGGGSYEMAKGDRWETGNPLVDPHYQRWSLRTTSDAVDGNGSVAATPASRPLVMAPSNDSLFHGLRP
jgi:hypothetical protein